VVIHLDMILQGEGRGDLAAASMMLARG